LAEERLEDVSQRRRDLEFSIEKKRLELLERKRTQLIDMKQSDPGLEKLLEETRDKVRAYEAALVPAPEPLSGMVRLGRKTDDGRVVPVKLEAAGAAPAAPAE
jgi:hypothetical protein